jgi:hypothetical protein
MAIPRPRGDGLRHAADQQPHGHAAGAERQSQTNVGIDVGADWTPDRTVKLSVTSFYEIVLALLQSPKGILDWIAVPNFLEMRP